MMPLQALIFIPCLLALIFNFIPRILILRWLCNHKLCECSLSPSISKPRILVWPLQLQVGWGRGSTSPLNPSPCPPHPHLSPSNTVGQAVSPCCGGVGNGHGTEYAKNYLTCRFKGSLQWEKRGAGKIANVRNRSQTVAIEVCLSFNLVVISNFNVFPFPPSKPILIGDVPMSRQNAAARRIFFFLFCNAHCLLTHRIILRH